MDAWDKVLAEVVDLRTSLTKQVEQVQEKTNATHLGLQSLASKVVAFDTRLKRVEESNLETRRISDQGDNMQSAALQNAMNVVDTKINALKTETDKQTKDIVAIKAATNEQTETLVAIHDKVKTVVSHPIAKKIAYGLGFFVLSWLANHGVKW